MPSQQAVDPVTERVAQSLERVGKATINGVAEVGFGAVLFGQSIFWMILGSKHAQPRPHQHGFRTLHGSGNCSGSHRHHDVHHHWHDACHSRHLYPGHVWCRIASDDRSGDFSRARIRALDHGQFSWPGERDRHLLRASAPCGSIKKWMPSKSWGLIRFAL